MDVHRCLLERRTWQDSGATSLVTECGMSNGCPWDTGGLDNTVGPEWYIEDGISNRPLSCPVHLSNGHPLDIYFFTVGSAWSVRLENPIDISWKSIGQVDWSGQWDHAAWSVRLVCPCLIDVQWKSIGQVDWSGHWPLVLSFVPVANRYTCAVG